MDVRFHAASIRPAPPRYCPAIASKALPAGKACRHWLCLQGFSPVRPVTPGIAPRFPAIALDWFSFLRALTAPLLRFSLEDDVWYIPQKKTAYKRLWCVLANFIPGRLYLGLKALPEGFSEADVDKCGKNVDNLWITLEKLLKTCTSTCSLE